MKQNTGLSAYMSSSQQETHTKQLLTTCLKSINIIKGQNKVSQKCNQSSTSSASETSCITLSGHECSDFADSLRLFITRQNVLCKKRTECVLVLAQAGCKRLSFPSMFLWPNKPKSVWADRDELLLLLLLCCYKIVMNLIVDQYQIR